MRWRQGFLGVFWVLPPATTIFVPLLELPVALELPVSIKYDPDVRDIEYGAEGRLHQPGVHWSENEHSQGLMCTV